MKKTALTAVTVAASLAVAAPAFATDTSATDPISDVLQTYYGYASVGAYDGDITSATVSYNQSVVTVTTSFVELDNISLNSFYVNIDTNADGKGDYIAASTRYSPTAGTGDLVIDSATATAMGIPAVAYNYGAPGSITMSFPAAMIGAPTSFNTQILAGFTASNGSYFNLDAIPQDAAGNLSWTTPVSDTLAAPVIEPAPPTVVPAPIQPTDTVTVTKAHLTKTVATISSHHLKFHGKTGATITITIKGAEHPDGRAAVFDGTKKIKTVRVKHSHVKFHLPKSLKVGTHKIRVKFTPTSSANYKKSTSKAVTLKIHR